MTASPTSCSVVWLCCPPGRRTVARTTLSRQLCHAAASCPSQERGRPWPLCTSFQLTPWYRLPRFNSQCSLPPPGLHALIPRFLHVWPGCLLHVIRPRLTAQRRPSLSTRDPIWMEVPTLQARGRDPASCAACGSGRSPDVTSVLTAVLGEGYYCHPHVENMGARAGSVSCPRLSGGQSGLKSSGLTHSQALNCSATWPLSPGREHFHWPHTSQHVVVCPQVCVCLQSVDLSLERRAHQGRGSVCVSWLQMQCTHKEALPK